MPSFQIDPELQRPSCDDAIPNLCWLAREILATHMEEGTDLTDDTGSLVNEAEDIDDSLTIHQTTSVSINKNQTVSLSNLPLIHDARGEVIPWTEPGYVALNIENTHTEDDTQYIFQLPTPHQTKAAIFSGFSFTERAQLTVEDSCKLQRLDKLLHFVRGSLRHQMETNADNFKASYHGHVPRLPSTERFTRELADFWEDEIGQQLKDLPFERHETAPVELSATFAEIAYETLTTYGNYRGRAHEGNWIEKAVTDHVEFGEKSQYALRLSRVSSQSRSKKTFANSIDESSRDKDSDAYMGIALECGIANGNQADEYEISDEHYNWSVYVLVFTNSQTGISELFDGATGKELVGSDVAKAFDYLTLLKTNLASISFDSALSDSDEDSTAPRSTPLPAVLSEYPHFDMAKTLDNNYNTPYNGVAIEPADWPRLAN